MLKNIESTHIRPEFKVRIYTQYAMSSIRFALTVHDLTSTQRKSLDSLTTRYRRPPVKYETNSIFFIYTLKNMLSSF